MIISIKNITQHKSVIFETMNNHNSNIPYLIKQLLKEGKSVYLPNIGELSPVVESAFFDKVSNKLYPPKYDYIFNEEGSVNSNLIDRLITNNFASSSNADSIIQKYSSNLFDDILNTGSTKIQGVGTLLTNGNGVIFNQDISLTDVHLEELKPVYVTPQNKSTQITDKKTQPTSTDWLPLIIGLIIGFLLIGGYFLLKGFIDIASSAGDKTELMNYASTQKVNTDVVQLDTLQKYSNDVNYLIDKKTKTITHNYVIVTGKLSDEKNVEEMISLIESIDHQVVNKDHQTLTRVGVLMSCEEVDVNNNLEEIKSRLTNDAWILDSQS